jgi:hypothetical protein
VRGPEQVLIGYHQAQDVRSIASVAMAVTDKSSGLEMRLLNPKLKPRERCHYPPDSVVGRQWESQAHT